MSGKVLEQQAEADRKVIVRAYRGLMRACEANTDKSERKEIRRAFEYALEAHEGARRKSGEPYILHPIAVAKIVAKEIGLGATSVKCALLHDVVEDTFVELSDITREFGSEIALIIDGLTKISGVFDHKSSAQAENFRKMLLTLGDDVRVILIKLADRLHNMRTLEFMKREGQLKIASETLYLYAPLGHRLGLQAIKSELEDLALRWMHPGTYTEISNKLKKFQRESRYYISKFTKTVRQRLQAAGLKFTLFQRYKSIYSIYSKMMRQDIPFEEVYDLFAIRVILDSPRETEKTDCFRVFSLLTEAYKPNPDRFRDWITLPKANGYEALHVTVMGPRGRWVEVQIRSERMDRVAERGVAAHWKYKESGSQYDEGYVKWLEQVRELLENPTLNAVEVVKEFKTLVIDEVFAFTPKGDLVRLPQKSTVLDFAYEIHTNIGHQCIGAKVNNKVVPIKYTLHNGDQVEILTSKKQQPKDEWLTIAKSPKAKNRIKEALRKQRRYIIEGGRKIVDWSLRSYDFDRQQLTREILAFFSIPSEEEFFFLLGSHQIDNKKLQEFIELKKKGQKIPLPGVRRQHRKRLETRQEFENWLKENKGVDSDALMIGQDMEVMDYTFGQCCQPIRGDEIIGVWRPGEGVEIHRVDCKVAVHLMSTHGRNILKAKWTELHSITFLAGIRINGTDRQGMMGDIIKVISNQMKLNIRSITIDSPDEMFEGFFKVFVKGTEDLDELKRRLKAVPGVIGVSRIQEIEGS